MHGQFLSQLLNFIFVTPNQQVRVRDSVDGCFVLNFHHPGGEFESRSRFFEVSCFGPDVGDHYCFTVSTQTVPQQVGELGLTVRDMFTLTIAKG